MRLGFLTHVQGRGSLAETYRRAQELFVVADELGFDVGWVAQHHTALQFNPGIPDFDAAVHALELIAKEIAPALGWSPAR